MIISNEVARELLELDVGDSTVNFTEDGSYPVNFKLVHEEMIDTSRWDHIHERVYLDLKSGKYWHTTYRTGATECQDTRAYEYDGDEITLTEVVPKEITIIEYVRKK